MTYVSRPAHTCLLPQLTNDCVLSSDGRSAYPPTAATGPVQSGNSVCHLYMQPGATHMPHIHVYFLAKTARQQLETSNFGAPPLSLALHTSCPHTLWGCPICQTCKKTLPCTNTRCIYTYLVPVPQLHAILLPTYIHLASTHTKATAREDLE